MADRRVTGRLDMHLALAGSLAVPTGKGRLEVAGGRYEDLALGILLTDIKASVTAGSGKGPEAGARACGGLHERRARRPGDGRGQPASRRRQARSGCRHEASAPPAARGHQATLSGTASVKGTLMAPQVAADITIDEALVNLNRLTGSSVTTLPVEGTSEARNRSRKRRKDTAPWT